MANMYVDIHGFHYMDAAPHSPNDQQVIGVDATYSTLLTTTHVDPQTLRSALISAKQAAGLMKKTTGWLASFLLATSILGVGAGKVHALEADCFVQPPYGTTLPCAVDATSMYNNTLATGSVSSTTGLFTTGTALDGTAVSNNQVILGTIDTMGAQSFAFQTTSTGTTMFAQAQESDDGTNWNIIPVQSSASTNMLASNFGGNPASGTGPIHLRYLRFVSNTAATPTTFHLFGFLRTQPVSPFTLTPATSILSTTGPAIRSTATYNPPYGTTTGYMVTTPYSIPEQTWQYSTNGTAITTNTSVTLQAAGAATVRNYLGSFSCDNTGTGVATELQILDGATVIYDGFIGAASATLNDPHYTVTFPIPLRGTAATSMSLKVVTTGAALYCAAQGYQAF